MQLHIGRMTISDMQHPAGSNLIADRIPDIQKRPEICCHLNIQAKVQSILNYLSDPCHQGFFPAS